jgi:ribosomal-protein-alanine N-acetyltransferase
VKPLVRAEVLTRAHAASLFAHVADPLLYAYIPGPPPASPEALAQQYERLAAGCPDATQIWLNWVAFHGRDPVGTLQATIFSDASATIAYVMFRAYWGRGFASQGCRWLLAELFDSRSVQFARAYIDERNAASIRVALAAGLRPLDAASDPDLPVGDRLFGLSADDWSKTRR